MLIYGGNVLKRKKTSDLDEVRQKVEVLGGLVSGAALGDNLVAWSEIAPSEKQDALSMYESIANPTGGSTADTEARAAINKILTALRGNGIINT